LRILINGEGKELDDGVSLSELIDLLDLPAQRVAVELNREVVRRTDWNRTILKNDDHLEIVHFVGGGTGFSSSKDSV
jgi:thiamine biosynthesis protein ThiS